MLYLWNKPGIFRIFGTGDCCGVGAALASAKNALKSFKMYSNLPWKRPPPVKASTYTADTLTFTGDAYTGEYGCNEFVFWHTYGLG